MLDPPPLVPLELGEVRDLSDHQMVFRSNGDSTPRKSVKPVKVKHAKSRLKIRKSTPTPPSKGNGRKRFVSSPLPEDKQLRKKLTFGNDGSPTSEEPKCKGAIFPPNTRLEVDEPPMAPNDENMANIVSIEEESVEANAEPNDIKYEPILRPHAASGDVTGDGEIEPVKDIILYRPQPNEETNPKNHPKTECIILPEMVMETNPLLESCLVTYPSHESRDSLTVVPHVQPKRDDLIRLVSLDQYQLARDTK